VSDLNLQCLTDAQLRLYAVRCVRRVQRLMTDPRSVAALDVAERHAKGEATDKELSTAWAAAWAAAEAAAEDAADAAAEAAADAAWAGGGGGDGCVVGCGGCGVGGDGCVVGCGVGGVGRRARRAEEDS